MEPKQPWLENLLETVLGGIAHERSELLGADITALRPQRPHHQPLVFATYGIGGTLGEIQLRNFMGPTRDAAVTEGPVTCEDLWNDDRWPKLDLDRACTLFPEHTHALKNVFGAVAFPGLRDNGSLVIISAYLSSPLTTKVVDLLSRYERLVGSAIATRAAVSGPEQRAQRVVAVLRTRDVVEQAKGIVMAMCRTDDATAWMLLHEVSRQSNIMLSTLAAELVDHVVEPKEQRRAKVAGVTKGRRIATDLWRALTHSDTHQSTPTNQ